MTNYVLKITVVSIESGKKCYTFNNGVTAVYDENNIWRDQHGDMLHNDYTALIAIENGLTVGQCLTWIHYCTIKPTKENLRKIRFHVLCLRLLLANETTLCC